jgi:hypothetical protein
MPEAHRIHRARPDARAHVAQLGKAGIALIVWNRSPAKSQVLADAGAHAAATIDEVLGHASTVFMMLFDRPPIDAVLGRGTPRFATLVSGRTSVMRADDRQPDAMFSDVSAEQRVPQDHPPRAIRALVDGVVCDMSREFDRPHVCALTAAVDSAGAPAAGPAGSRSSTRSAASGC